MLLKWCISVSKRRLGSFQWAQPECSLCPTVEPSNSLAFHFTGFWPNNSAGYCKSTLVTHPFVLPLLPLPNMQSPCVREWQGGRTGGGFCTWHPESGLNTRWLPIYLTYIKSLLSYSHPVPLWLWDQLVIFKKTKKQKKTTLLLLITRAVCHALGVFILSAAL